MSIARSDVEAIHKTKVYEKIALQIQRLICDGALKPGESFRRSANWRACFMSVAARYGMPFERLRSLVLSRLAMERVPWYALLPPIPFSIP